MGGSKKNEKTALLLWLRGIKKGKPAQTPAPEWIEVILLAQRSGMSIAEILDLHPIWVERLKEYFYQCAMQGVRPN
jgi:hypothetical protein